MLCQKVNKSVRITAFKPGELLILTERKIWKTSQLFLFCLGGRAGVQEIGQEGKKCM